VIARPSSKELIMARRILVAGNWKLHKTVDESVELAKGVMKVMQAR
jgi:triosephosphate isomerase